MPHLPKCIITQKETLQPKRSVSCASGKNARAAGTLFPVRNIDTIDQDKISPEPFGIYEWSNHSTCNEAYSNSVIKLVFKRLPNLSS